jgi:pimeloyl-ACP methyl ester carboxylesterase
MERLRTRLYSAPGARGALLATRLAAKGDFSVFDALPPGLKRSFADGLYLSIACAESLPHFALDEASASARATAFGDYRLRRQSAACTAWPVAPSMPPSPTRALQIPVLFVSGEFDPVTPPEWVDDLLPLFPNGRHIILPGGGHIVDGMSDLDTCYDPTIVAFLDSADAADLDVACIESMRAPAFATE